jgi:excisionase family DNA binding protein
MDIKYYSVREAAKLLKVAYLTVYRWIQLGKLKSDRAGKQYRISNLDLQEFIKNR